MTEHSSGLFLMHNPIQAYAWGSRDGLSKYAGIVTDSSKPAAECWMGSHPLAPSIVRSMDGRESPLDTLIRQQPDMVLGKAISLKYGELPFLFKVLSAAKPLSIQVHPSKEKAEAGFARENSLGIPLASPDRNYKDKNHKPEMAIALSKFTALCGFRPPQEARELMGPAICDFLKFPHEPKSDDFIPFLGRLLTISVTQRQRLQEMTEQRARFILQNCSAETTGSVAAASAAQYCYAEYPGDPGALAPFFLTLVTLAPGQGLYVPAGVLHSYLEGTILEIMAASDNVIRGGMTSKKIDVTQLVDVIDPGARPLYSMPTKEGALCDTGRTGVTTWQSPASEFELSMIELDGCDTVSIDREGPKILLCTEGRIAFSDIAHNAEPAGSLTIQAGQSVFVADTCRHLRANGTGRLYCASVSSRERS
ncbi:MAG: mannose-6-phosphate isomerase, class I [Spirochaetaceae bacterium]|nr:mannose-6-phosphate isomerase, class I [Spirochaetaceae bacterium]